MIITSYIEFMGQLAAHSHEYRIIHAHNGAKQAIVLDAAEEAGIPERIAHAHSTSFLHDDRYEQRLHMLSAIRTHATRYFACGNDAGRFFFGDASWQSRGTVMYNSIDRQAFAFDQTLRERMRDRLDLHGCLVMGHVGRFQPQKNQQRLLKILSATLKHEKNARLIMIGDGPQRQAIIEQAREMGLSSCVLIPGMQENMRDWYCCMDVFVMPSLFEGLPVASVEAQACGLPCVFSTAITRESGLTSKHAFISLESNDALWSESVMYLSKAHYGRRQCQSLPQCYDISHAASQLMDFYCRIYR